MSICGFKPEKADLLHKEESQMPPIPKIIAGGGESFDFGGLGVKWKIAGPDTGQRFAVIT